MPKIEIKGFLVSSGRFLGRWAWRSLSAMVLLILHSTDLYATKLREVLPENWRGRADDVMAIVDEGAFWIAILIAIFAALYTFYEVDRYVRDPKVSAKLKAFYSAGERFVNMKIANGGEFEAYETEMFDWSNSTSQWITENMGEAASSQFRRKENIMPFSHANDYNDKHMGYINYVSKLRDNLSRLIESGEWDSDG